MVAELFATVEDKNVTAPRWEEHPFDDEHFKTLVYISPVKDVRNLNIVFPSVDLTPYYKSAVSTVSSKGKNCWQFGLLHKHFV